MKNIKIIIAIAFTIFAFSSCQKVIDLDVKNAPPRFVAYGGVSDQGGPYSITLSKTINYDEPNVFPTVSGATVTIKDNFGNSETLIENVPGVYSTNALIGTVGRTYQLDITESGNTYSSSAKMASPVAIDSVYLGTFSTPGGLIPALTTTFQDPPGENNYYYINYLINGVELRSYDLISDDLIDGQKIEIFTVGDYDDIDLGDTITVQLQSIDASMFDYYLALQALDESGGGGLGSSVPNNPTSNITGDVLGYFKVYSQTERDYIIQ